MSRIYGYGKMSINKREEEEEKEDEKEKDEEYLCISILSFPATRYLEYTVQLSRL